VVGVRDARAAVLALTGDLCGATVLTVEPEVTRLLASNRPVRVVDLAEIGSYDSAGLAMLDACGRASAVAGVELRLVAPREPVGQALQARGVTSRLRVFASLDGATRGDARMCSRRRTVGASPRHHHRARPGQYRARRRSGIARTTVTFGTRPRGRTRSRFEDLDGGLTPGCPTAQPGGRVDRGHAWVTPHDDAMVTVHARGDIDMIIGRLLREVLLDAVGTRTRTRSPWTYRRSGSSTRSRLAALVTGFKAARGRPAVHGGRRQPVDGPTAADDRPGPVVGLHRQ
jgi:anti-anti-sigma factor